MWVWFAPVGVAWVKWWIGMVGRGYFLGIFWHGGTFFWVFLMLIGLSGVKSAFFWAFLGVFLGIFGVSWVFLGIFWVDWYIFWVFSMLIGVSGVKSAFFWVFSVYHGFFWVFSGLIGIFSGYFRWPGFQIGGVGF